MNKTKLILEHLKAYPSGITSWEAIQKFRATRLSAIIFNLKKMGYHIVTRKENNSEASWVRYILIPSKEKQTTLFN